MNSYKFLHAIAPALAEASVGLDTVERLARLGAQALKILEDTPEWSSETADVIGEEAIALGLGSPDGDGSGQFKIAFAYRPAVMTLAAPGSPEVPAEPKPTVAPPPASAAPPSVKPSFPPPSAKKRIAARTALAATLGLDSRELSDYSYQPGRFTPALYCVGGSFWAVSKTKPTADVGNKWKKAKDQFWAEQAGTVVWQALYEVVTRTEIKKRGGQ